jgi:uncharacterized protein with GYD domain
MPTFVVLGTLTQKRMETIKELPENIKASRPVFESYGVKIQTIIFTLGRYARARKHQTEVLLSSNVHI